MTVWTLYVSYRTPECKAFTASGKRLAPNCSVHQVVGSDHVCLEPPNSLGVVVLVRRSEPRLRCSHQYKKREAQASKYWMCESCLTCATTTGNISFTFNTALSQMHAANVRSVLLPSYCSHLHQVRGAVGKKQCSIKWWALQLDAGRGSFQRIFMTL